MGMRRKNKKPVENKSKKRNLSIEVICSKPGKGGTYVACMSSRLVTARED
jgi:hypothetical protein